LAWKLTGGESFFLPFLLLENKEKGNEHLVNPIFKTYTTHTAKLGIHINIYNAAGERPATAAGCEQYKGVMLCC
jgi:hypothetical protein